MGRLPKYGDFKRYYSRVLNVSGDTLGVTCRTAIAAIPTSVMD
jgi:hypothetical protein